MVYQSAKRDVTEPIPSGTAGAASTAGHALGGVHDREARRKSTVGPGTDRLASANTVPGTAP